MSHLAVPEPPPAPGHPPDPDDRSAARSVDVSEVASGNLRRDLRCLFAPASVAVVGASDDPRKWGNWLARNALRGAHRREVTLVNRRGGTVLGRPAHRSTLDLPAPPELVALAVPAAAFDRALDEALAVGARAILAVTAGLAETGAAGARREQAAVARVREAGAVLLGPNCLGVMDATSELHLTSNDLPAGSIGLISQSGNLALEVAAKAGAAGLGFSRFASIGNQADLDVADLVADFAQAPGVEAIALYCEDFRRGRRFLEVAADATGAGTPIVMVAVAAGGAAARAARSHTGAIVSGQRSLTAACRAAGIEQVSTPRELVDLLQGLLARKSPTGPRLAVVADGGGHAAVAAGLAESHRLEVPSLPAGVSARLAEATGTAGGTTNPVDLAGAGENDLWSFTRVVETLLAADEVDAVLMTGYFGGYGAYGDGIGATEHDVAGCLADLTAGQAKPLIVHSMIAAAAGTEPALDRLRTARVPVYPDIESAVGVAARLRDRTSQHSWPPPTLPPQQPGPATGGYFSARALLGAAGFVFLPARAVRDLSEAHAAAVELGWPVAVKAVALEHKSDAGGVVLGVGDAATLETVTTDLWSRLGPGALSVEVMADPTDGIEMLVGCVRDPRFGPVAVAGIGGIHAEILTDVAAALAPLDQQQAEELIASLRGAPLITGARGRAPLDLPGAARALVILSQVAASHPAVVELEVNPLLVTSSGVYGLDARMVLEPPGRSGTGEPGSHPPGPATRPEVSSPAAAAEVSASGSGGGGATP